MAGNVLFTYHANTQPGSIVAPLPRRAVRLINEGWLISNQVGKRDLDIDPCVNLPCTKSADGCAWQRIKPIDALSDAQGDWGYAAV
jgi:hypothetical protein